MYTVFCLIEAPGAIARSIIKEMQKMAWDFGCAPVCLLGEAPVIGRIRYLKFAW